MYRVRCGICVYRVDSRWGNCQANLRGARYGIPDVNEEKLCTHIKEKKRIHRPLHQRRPNLEKKHASLLMCPVFLLGLTRCHTLPFWHLRANRVEIRGHM